MSYYQTIYNKLRAEGLTESGALGILGNWDCESNCEPNRKQGDFSPYRTASKEYTAKIMSGEISKAQFANGRIGYGLAQWTLGSRQAELYDFWRASGKAIDDLEMQISFAIKELKRDFHPDWQLLCSTSNMYEATEAICFRFENPKIKNVDARFQSANRIKTEIDLNPEPVPPEPPQPEPPEPEPPKPDVYWPPRTIDSHCADWPEVTVLGAILYCRGYINYAAGSWDDEVTQAVKDFQFDNGLNADGVVGKMTWKALLEMG